MTAAALLDTLRARGIVARVEDGNLKLKPARVLDAELRAELQRLKPELLELLAAPDVEIPDRKRENESSTRTALERLRMEAEALQVAWCPGLVRVTSRLVALWREAEKETGQKLTISGRPRRAPAFIASDYSLLTLKTVNKEPAKAEGEDDGN